MTDSAIKYVGVDGCKAGWIGVGLSDGGCWEVKACVDFSDMLAHFGDACVILVDMPIGLPEDGKPTFRACDEEARRELKGRGQSVFQVPSRRFVKEVVDNPCWVYREANGWSKDQYDAGISAQSFAITRKIGEVDAALSCSDKNDSPKLREAHPEVCFWALNGKKPMSKSKNGLAGYNERLDTLRDCAHEVDDIDVYAISKEIRCKFTKTKVADDDILDALAIAITAKIGCENGFMTLPDKPPTDNSKKKLPMEMVYALPNDEGTPC